jgi:hypothetical protein
MYGTRRAHVASQPQQERGVADEKRDDDQEMGAAGGEPREGQSGAPGENNEWLRDQVGEDHNLSGSSTYRTLPDQPEGEQPDQDSGDADAKGRQSNR